MSDRTPDERPTQPDDRPALPELDASIAAARHLSPAPDAVPPVPDAAPPVPNAVPPAPDAAPAAPNAVPAAPDATPPVLRRPVVDVPTEDVAVVGDAARLPGEHRGGFQRAMTEPVPITQPVHTEVRWAPPPPAPLPRSAGWAMTFAILGLLVSFLVGWGFLIGLVGAGFAIVALRRPWERRGVALWALCLSLLSLVYSAGWLWWASTQANLFG